MVLHHVPHCAGFIVIGTPPFDPHRLGHSDFDMVDVVVVPKRLEQHVAKPDRHQVLDGLLTQVMVDAVNLAFIEMLGQRLVQRLRCLKIATKGFFHHHAAVRVSNFVTVQAFGEIAKQAGSNGEIEGVDDLEPDQVVQFFPTGLTLGVHRNIMQLGNEFLDPVFVSGFFTAKLCNRLADHGPVAIRVQIGPCRTDDTAGPGHLA